MNQYQLEDLISDYVENNQQSQKGRGREVLKENPKDV